MQIAKRLSRASEYFRQGLIEPARISYEAALSAAEGHDAVRARLGLSHVHLARSDLREASGQMAMAARLAADVGMPAAQRLDLVHSLLQFGEHRAAADVLSSIDPRELPGPTELMRAAACFRSLHMHDEALSLLTAGFIRPGGDANDELAYHYAIQLNFCGEIVLSNALLKALVERRCANTRAHLMLSRASKTHDPEWLVREIDHRLRTAVVDSERIAPLYFARFNELHRMGQYAGAWEALEAGNASMKSRLRYDHARERATLERLRSIQWDLIPDAPKSYADGPQPIFIVGLPRSGTTLLERMLGRHPEITAIGELTDFSKQLRWVTNTPGVTYIDPLVSERLGSAPFDVLGRRYLDQVAWRITSGRYFIDKQPPNVWAIGAIFRAIPRARVIVVRRAPMDVCFSNYRALFGDSYEYSYDLQWLAQHHRLFEEVLAFWGSVFGPRIHEVRYEDLVGDPERVLRATLCAMGLGWDSSCADPEQNNGPVATLSSAQVRESIHRRAIREWIPYASRLEPLQSLLD